MEKLDFTIETMEEICGEYFELLKEHIAVENENIEITVEGHNDYAEVNILENNEFVCAVSIKFIALYDAYLKDGLEHLATVVGDKILDDEWRSDSKETYIPKQEEPIEINVEDTINETMQKFNETIKEDMDMDEFDSYFDGEDDTNE